MIEKLNLSKYIGNSGALSRRKAAQAVRDGLVSVNNIVVTEPGTLVDCGDIVRLNNQEIMPNNQFCYLAFNKPPGYLCSRAGLTGRDKTIFELLPDVEGLTFAGRLDKDSEGLLLLSNNGDFINQVAHPSFEVWKCYLVITSRMLSLPAQRKIRAGFNHLGEFLKVLELTVLPGVNRYLFILNEGKKREIRRLVQGAEPMAKVITLRRISTGLLELGDLKTGSWRYLSTAEIDSAKTPRSVPELNRPDRLD